MVAVLAAGCERGHTAQVAAHDSVRVQAATPAYLRSIFHSLDSLVPAWHRDSLRNLSLDSAWALRTRRVTEEAQPLVAGWMESPIVDSIKAHGEQPYMTPEIVLDLYQQYLRGDRPDLAGALHRVTPEYVASIRPHRLSVDSVLLERDLDGNGIADHLVREASRRPVDIDAADRDSAAAGDTVFFVERRLALYLNVAPSPTATPAWTTSFDSEGEADLFRAIDRKGETLLFIQINGADADEAVVLLVRRGAVQQILHHQINYGEGDFDLSEKAGRVALVASGDLEVSGRGVEPKIECPREAWPGLALAYNDTTRQFVIERSVCVPRR